MQLARVFLAIFLIGILKSSLGEGGELGDANSSLTASGHASFGKLDFNSLPEEIKFHILSYLEEHPRSFFSFACTSKGNQKIAEEYSSKIINLGFSHSDMFREYLQRLQVFPSEYRWLARLERDLLVGNIPPLKRAKYTINYLKGVTNLVFFIAGYYYPPFEPFLNHFLLFHNPDNSFHDAVYRKVSRLETSNEKRRSVLETSKLSSLSYKGRLVVNPFNVKKEIKGLIQLKLEEYSSQHRPLFLFKKALNDIEKQKEIGEDRWHIERIFYTKAKLLFYGKNFDFHLHDRMKDQVKSILASMPIDYLHYKIIEWIEK